MVSVLVVGKGHVGHHLYNALSKINTVTCTFINSRELVNLPKTDITIVTVSDNAIAQVSSKIKNTLVVHTSGATDINGLENTTRKGVFYMLQSFTKNVPVDFSEVPFCLEAENETDYKLLEKLAKTLSTKVFKISSEQRKILHVSAVFVNNFTNHMYKIGADICNAHNIPFAILQPLILKTATKIKHTTPENAQTGPAIRQDTNTINNHLTLLNEHQKNIYSLLTKSIQNEH